MAFNWKAVVGGIAPVLSTALGGPLAGAATAAVCRALGLGNDASEEDIINGVKNMTPEQVLELKKADLEFKRDMARLNVDLAALAVQDKASAREREKSVGSRIPEILAYGAILFFLINTVGAFALIFCKIPMTDTGNYLLGACNTGSVALLKNVYDYYFGSNIDSLTRDNMIYNSTPLEKQKD